MVDRKLVLIPAVALLIAGCGAPVGTRSTPDPISPSPSSLASEGEDGEAAAGEEDVDAAATKDVANDPSESPSPVPEIVTTSISGVVTDDYEDPVEGICVDWTHGDDHVWPFRQTFERTDEAGRYVITIQEKTGLAHGVKIRFRDCRSSPSLAFEWFDDVKDQRDAKIIERGANYTANAQLAPAAKLAGSVTNVGGNRLSGICVLLYDGTYQGRNEESSYTYYALTTTSDTGDYSFDGLSPKEYRIRFETYGTHCGGTSYTTEWYDDFPHPTEHYAWPSWHPSDTVRLSVGEQRAGIDAVLECARTACEGSSPSDPSDT